MRDEQSKIYLVALVPVLVPALWVLALVQILFLQSVLGQVALDDEIQA